MSIPEAIKAHRQTQFGAVEIRRINNHYYVYLISSKWNAEKKRAQKVTGKSIGKITEVDGFIPNANGLHLMKEKRMTPDVTCCQKIWSIRNAASALPGYRRKAQRFLSRPLS